MDLFTIVIIAIALSFDTFAVSVSCGIFECKIRFWQAARIASFFSVFQAIMPVLGWFLGYSVRQYIVEIDHWIAFGLLLLIGAKMISESFKKEEEKQFNPHSIKVILTMSFATTIDAFIVGISFALIKINLLQASLVIGVITFLAAMLGMLFGKKIGSHFGSKVEFLGGIILIAIGTKILFEHLL